MKKFFATVVSVYVALSLIASCAVAFHGGACEGNTILENRAPLTVVTIKKDNGFTDICIYNPLTDWFDDVAVLIRF
jgi:hypothetical protein